jgi:transposase-like protein
MSFEILKFSFFIYTKKIINFMKSGIVKYGKTKKGVQIFKNNETGKFSVEKIKFSPIFKMLCVFLYYKGLSYRRVGEIMGTTHVSVYIWVRKFSDEFVKNHELSNVSEIADLEIDELYTYYLKKKIKFT